MIETSQISPIRFQQFVVSKTLVLSKTTPGVSFQLKPFSFFAILTFNVIVVFTMNLRFSINSLPEVTVITPRECLEERNVHFFCILENFLVPRLFCRTPLYPDSSGELPRCRTSLYPDFFAELPRCRTSFYPDFFAELPHCRTSSFPDFSAEHPRCRTSSLQNFLVPRLLCRTVSFLL